MMLKYEIYIWFSARKKPLHTEDQHMNFTN